MRKINISPNDRYGRLSIIKELPIIIDAHGRHQRKVLCKCDCGNYKEIRLANIIRGLTVSCGCYKKERQLAGITKYGLFHHPLHGVWKTMINRCYNPNVSSYKNYGERGISVCEEWKHDFMTFYNWAISNGYKKGFQIDRINNNGNYYPENCRWTTQMVQSNNTRVNIHFTINGETMTLAEICRKFNLKYIAVYLRLKRGWNIERAIIFNKQ